jgi:hypothetical protein
MTVDKIDPKTLEVGDVVTLTGTVEKLYDCTILVPEEHGYCLIGGNEMFSDLTITKVEKPVKPFDWKDVKWGMAFIPKDEKYFGYYIGRDKDDFVVLDVEHTEEDSPYCGWRESCLTRAHEHDLPEVK